ncbi:MAG: hypothetical protein NTU74_01735 [Deltaproteobacteria bacterium]|nr:hypothetical protein [Deltaproteobacteria bacterium]
MRRLLKCAALMLMALMVMSGSVWAWNYTEHVTTAPNNKGDVLIFPYFLALDGGWETKLTVINTDEVNSVVAKVVIRSFKNSEELLDFFIYLTPADVWTGRMMVDTVTKRVVIDSTDDSVLGSTSGIAAADICWAGASSNCTAALATKVCVLHQVMFPLNCSDDADYLGYSEVITAASGNAGARPLCKTTLWTAYENFKAGSTAVLNFPSVNHPNVLAGYMQVQNAVAGLSANLRATNLKDYETNVILDTAAETRLGVGARNNLLEVEAALSKDDIAMPYVNDKDLALHIFTFPTKLTVTTGGCALGQKTADGPYFGQYSADPDFYCVPFRLRIFDLLENSPTGGSPFSGGDTTVRRFCDEVNLIGASAFPYKEGWAHYWFTNAIVAGYAAVDAGSTQTHPLSYVGTPVLPTFLYVGATGLTANYGAWTDDFVYCSLTAATTLIDYQYTDSALGACVGP